MDNTNISIEININNDTDTKKLRSNLRVLNRYLNLKNNRNAESNLDIKKDNLIKAKPNLAEPNLTKSNLNDSINTLRDANLMIDDYMKKNNAIVFNRDGTNGGDSDE